MTEKKQYTGMVYQDLQPPTFPKQLEKWGNLIKTKAIQADLGIVTHIPVYSGIFRPIHT